MSDTMHLLLIVLALVTLSNAKITCIGDDGSPVDMFILYKLPRIEDYKVPDLVADGHGYAYLDSNSKEFKFSEISIASKDSAAGRTLDQVYSRYNTTKRHHMSSIRLDDGPNDQAHVFYNDEDPRNAKEYFYNGHTKGAVAFDQESGFWLITSVPKYPPAATDGYVYPHSGCMYGQMFMCVTFKASSFDDIGMQLRYNNPHVHSGNLPQGWETTFSNIHSLLQDDMMKKSPYSHSVPLTSLNGIKYSHYAKSTDFKDDLYHAFVAPSLKTDLLTETWQHGHVIGPSCDGEFVVEDIVNVTVNVPVQNFPFENYKDHSKFAISKSSAKPFVCIGDINREPSQFKRAGGTLCTEDLDIWKRYYEFVVKTNQCSFN